METTLQKPTIKRKRVRAGVQDLEQEIAALADLDLAPLRKKWAELFGFSPSPRLGASFIMRAVAYQLQVNAYGGLNPSTQRLLDRVCDGSGKLAHPPLPSRPGAGTVLIRKWHGTAHRVTVLDRGVVYQGRRYQSLSEVARVITGTRWSGPAFFGLNGGAKEVSGE